MDCVISKMTKKCFIAILFLLLLSACGRSTSAADGTYICEQIIKDGTKLEAGEFYSPAPVLTLYGNGKAKLDVNGKSCKGTWNYSDDVFVLSMGQFQSCGTLKDGVCAVDLFGQGVTYCFFRGDSRLPDWEKAAEETLTNNRWSGDWYGYWHLENASGEWENLDGMYFDCFAKVDVKSDNSGKIVIWDEKSSFSEPVSAVEISLDLFPSDGYGRAISESGFFFSDDIEENTWVIEPDNEALENVISFSAHYDGQDGGFDYFVFLRPWGYIWDDALEAGNVRFPYYYDSWYIPLLSDKQEMPEKFER